MLFISFNHLAVSINNRLNTSVFKIFGTALSIDTVEPKNGHMPKPKTENGE